MKRNLSFKRKPMKRMRVVLANKGIGLIIPVGVGTAVFGMPNAKITFKFSPYDRE